jgi:hypothetical protein
MNIIFLTDMDGHTLELNDIDLAAPPNHGDSISLRHADGSFSMWVVLARSLRLPEEEWAILLEAVPLDDFGKPQVPGFIQVENPFRSPLWPSEC